MGIEGVGARVARKEDKRFITGAGRYVDDMVVPGMKHAAFVRSPHAHADIKKIDVKTGARHARRHRRADRQGAQGGRHRQPDLRLDDPLARRLGDEDGRMVAARRRPRPLRRRCRRDRRCRDQGPGARRGRSRRHHLQGKEGGHRCRRRAETRRAAAPSRSREQFDLRLGAGRRRRHRCGDQPRPRMSRRCTSSTTGWFPTR